MTTASMGLLPNYPQDSVHPDLCRLRHLGTRAAAQGCSTIHGIHGPPRVKDGTVVRILATADGWEIHTEVVA